ATHVTGIRHARYLGLPKTRLEHNTAAAAINLIRLDAWWTGKPLDRTRTTHLQRLDLAALASMSQARRPWLLPELESVFWPRVCSGSGGWRGRVPGAPGAGPAPTAPGRSSFRRWDGFRCSAGGGQCAQPLPAGDERLCPRPVRADLEDLLAGVPEERGGGVA